MRIALIDQAARQDRWEALRADLPGTWTLLVGGPEAMDGLLEHAPDALLMAVEGGMAVDLMRRARECAPQTLRILVVDDMIDPARAAGQAARCGAQQLVVAPVRGSEIRRLLRRVMTVRSLLADPVLRARLGALERLPSAPDTYLALQAAVEDPDIDMGEVVALVQRDTGLATRVLRVANSALLSRGRPITDLGNAVQRLGLDTLAQLVLGTEVFGSPGVEAAALQQRGLLASRLAVRIAAEAAPRLPASQAGSAALLADVGRLLPQALLEQAALSGRWSRLPPASLLGACLLALWGLPMELVEAVAYRHAPAQVDPDRLGLAGLVHVSSALAVGDPLEEAYLAHLGLLDRVPSWQALARTLRASE